MQRFFDFHTSSTASDVDQAVVIPRQAGKQIVIRYITLTGGSAGAQLHILPTKQKGKCFLKGSAAANADALEIHLESSTATADTLNGTAVAASDYIVAKLDSPHDQRGAWQLMLIASVTGATAGELNVDNLTGYDGDNPPRAAMTGSATNGQGNECLVVWAEDVSLIPVGNATVTVGGDGGSVAAGRPGFPLALLLEAGGATAHHMRGLAEYVDA